jgi:hypothetical protein
VGWVGGGDKKNRNRKEKETKQAQGFSIQLDGEFETRSATCHLANLVLALSSYLDDMSQFP